MTYKIDSLPGTLVLGKQTEHGVASIRIDCSPWLAIWSDMVVSAWVTPPGGAAAYPADTHMESDVLVWDVGASDTATAGSGYVEVMGVADGKKKLSATAVTLVMSTTTDTATEPPEAAQPWVEAVISARVAAEDAAKRAEDAADRADKAAERAESAGSGGGAAGEVVLTDGETGKAYRLCIVNAKLILEEVEK